MNIEDIGLNKNKNHKNTIPFTKQMYTLTIKNKVEYIMAYSQCRRIFKFAPSKAELSMCYKQLITQNILSNNATFTNLITKKLSKSASGIVVITILTAPGKMLSLNGDASCPKNCHYCPSFPNQPKSYDPDEAAPRRASRNNFSPELQMLDRLSTLDRLGHNIEKVQLEISGGTWCFYPREYIDDFIKRCYYTANIYYDNKAMYKHKLDGGDTRDILSLKEEQTINENTKIKIIGITIETRPDSINKREIKRLREYGITRVQLGIQHTDNDILKYINRESTVEEAYEAIELLKVNCFKVDIHIMPDLPGSSIEKDKKMLNEFLTDERLQADFWKIYPCQVLNYTKIKEWYEDGTYKPYGEHNSLELAEMLCEIKKQIPRWVRINRIVRDFPNSSLIGGLQVTNLRQVIQDMMKKKGLQCKCIRCREIKNDIIEKDDKIIYTVETFKASGGTEYFISANTTKTDKLCGFLRFRINNENQKPFFKCLEDCSLIRELHVLGGMKNVGDYSNNNYQHKGIGKKLIKMAEDISIENNILQIAVISGVGVRPYYAKYNYELKDTFMVKTLTVPNYDYIIYICLFMFDLMMLAYFTFWY